MIRLLLALTLLAGFCPSGRADDRIPLPSAAERDRSTRLVRDLFKDEFANTDPAAMAELAAKFVQQAAEAEDDPASRFVLYKEAAELAAAGDIGLTLRACEAIADRFDIGWVDVIEPILAAAAPKVTKPEACTELATYLVQRVDGLLAADDDLEGARRANALADSSARRAKDLRLAGRVRAQAGEIVARKDFRDRAGAAASKLMVNPDDADACLVFGQYICFLKGDWANGLPVLAKGSDPKLKQSALKDLEAAADDSAGTIAVADAWYEAAGAVKDLPKTRLQLRAHALYNRALPTTTGLTRTRLQKRIEELETVLKGQFEYSELWPGVRAAARNQTYQRIEIMGGAFGDKAYSEVPAEGGILIGFNYTVKAFGNKDLIDCFQPIYLTPAGEKPGAVHGSFDGVRMLTLKAKPNFAIGKMAVRGGGLLGGLNVVFMRIVGPGLNPADKYESGWLGHDDQPNAPFLGDGRPIVGIHGRDQQNSVGICSIGLYVLGDRAPAPGR